MDQLRFTRRSMLATGAALAAAPAIGAAESSSRLVLLGTGGGPTPKPNRAATAQVITVGDAAYVVDCGNGVARQLVLAGIKLKALRSIFITHHHSDHNVDYGSLMLLAWAADLATPVNSYGPPPLAEMTQSFLDYSRVDIATRMADEGRPSLAGLIRPHDLTKAGLVMQDLNVRVTAALVDHPPLVPSFAYRFDCPDRSIVISGDTRPSEGLVTLARGADLLVHEVMYLPALEALIASEPNATTLREHLLASHTSAADVGKVATRAGVKTLVLSHFVPGGFPFVTDDQWRDAVRPHFAGEIIVGRDLMVL
jgi:ribonuclease BN (tRNA processing enzyme)